MGEHAYISMALDILFVRVFSCYFYLFTQSYFHIIYSVLYILYLRYKLFRVLHTCKILRSNGIIDQPLVGKGFHISTVLYD